ncbi:hypothetical protein [Streptomyces sp. NPDC059215]|uniref:hypothetical protein n=1 Tax=Streptomyces sp. NPDC059215 TaxID=3346772 RepID=UPI0036C24FBE
MSNWHHLDLPVVNWPELLGARKREDQWLGLHWKPRSLVAWAGGSPFACVDDEITDADRKWVSAHYPAQALFHRVASSRGLTEQDFAVLEQWPQLTPGSPRRSTGFDPAPWRPRAGVVV